MKVKITKKAVYATHKRTFATGACELHSLFSFINPYAYNSGVYGWNCDVYSYGVFAITTGYRAFGYRLPRELVKSYETRANEILKTISNWETKKAQIMELLEQFYDDLKTL